jgi:hypothetical protein
MIPFGPVFLMVLIAILLAGGFFVPFLWVIGALLVAVWIVWWVLALATRRTHTPQ